MPKLSLFVFSTVFLVALSATAQVAPAIPSLSQDQVTQLNNGEIIVDMNGDATPPVADAIGVVDAPPERVFELVADWPHHSEWFEDVRESEVLSNEGSGVSIERGVNAMPWPMSDRNFDVRVWDGQMEVDGVPAYVSTWDYIPGSGNMVDTEGYWLVIPWGDDGTKSLVRYYMTFDLGTPVPDFLINWGTENMLPSRIQVLRDLV